MSIFRQRRRECLVEIPQPSIGSQDPLLANEVDCNIFIVPPKKKFNIKMGKCAVFYIMT